MAGVITPFGVSFWTSICWWHPAASSTSRSTRPTRITYWIHSIAAAVPSTTGSTTTASVWIHPSRKYCSWAHENRWTRSAPSEVLVLGLVIVPGNGIKNLGVRLDKNLTFNKHVDEIRKSVHYHSRALRHIRGNLNTDTAKEFACAIGVSRLDYYCNGILYMQGISAFLTRYSLFWLDTRFSDSILAFLTRYSPFLTRYSLFWLDTRLFWLDTRLFWLDTRLFRLDTRLFRLDTRLFRLDTRLFWLDTRFFRLDTRLFWLDTRLFWLDTRLFRLDTRLFRLDTRLFRLDTRLFWLDTRLFWLDTRFFRLDTRLFWLDTRLFRLDTRLFWLDTRLFWLDTRLFCLDTRFFDSILDTRRLGILLIYMATK